MQVTQSNSDGLKRTMTIVVPVTEIVARFDSRLAQVKDTVKIKGFRPGHVPNVHLKKLYGRQVMGEVLDQAIKDTSLKALEERNERPAMQPEITLPEDRELMTQVLEGKADLSYSMSFEVLPQVEVADFAALKLEKVVADVDVVDIEAAIARLAEGNTTYTVEDGREAGDGDRLVLDFTGRIDGEAFEGGSATAAEIVIGQAQFIPGFEEGLKGAKAGESRTVEAVFPAAYPMPALAGKTAQFDVSVTSVAAPQRPDIDDAFATGLGATDLANLRDLVREQLQRELDQASRIKLKRELLDALDKAHSFALPESLVSHELDAIWNQLQANLKKQNKTVTDEGKSEDEVKAEYRAIAERRVRLGLLVGEIGDRNKIEVTQDELRRALLERAREFPGQERMVYEYFEKTPGAVAELRAPIFEEKVVDFMLSQASPTERKVSKEELFKLAEQATQA